MRTYKIAETREESPQVKSFFFDVKMQVYPGQFLMVWVPGVDEIPISVSYNDGKRVGISVAGVGEATRELNKKKKGDFLGLRGPYGNGFELDGKRVCVLSGGCGAAPIVFLAEELKKAGASVTSVVGAKSKGYLLFLDRFKNCGKVLMATDDGSEGYHGLVTDVLKEKIKDFDYVYTCGPEKCIEGVLDICLENKVPLQASLERYMKCGLGVCGSCMLGPWRVCADGPVFTDGQLKEVREEFGKFRRAPSGLKEAL